ncbi:hypothetical protein D1007_51068 [Hordeum vulgare]|nr:hypothetical protein D1007_51068 [Hordeum vulgare]
MAGSHTLTIDSVSKLKAVLHDGEYAYSTHFAVGGSTWYFRFCSKPYKCSCLYLVRASKAGEPPAATAEFSFQLEGVVNFESKKMRHAFDRDNRKFYFKLDSIADSPMHDDRLLVRCCLAVVMPEEIPTTVPTCRTEAVLTPLLSAMHG